MSTSLVPPEGLPPDAPPECVVPFGGSRQDFSKTVDDFVNFRWAPRDLSAANLLARARPVWWPMWLVDATVSGPWSVEVGFDVEVVSSEESLSNGRWVSRAVKKVKRNWETRVGWVARTYTNVMAPALADHELLIETLGEYNPQTAVSYAADLIEGGLTCPPDRRPDDVSGTVSDRLTQLVAKDVARAVGADGVRGPTLRATYARVHWTLLLLPAYVSWFHGDDGRREFVWIHGQTGKVAGPRRASVRRAGWFALAIAAFGSAVVLAGGLIALGGLALPVLLPVGAVIGGVGLMIAMLSVWPMLSSYAWNRRSGTPPRLSEVAAALMGE